MFVKFSDTLGSILSYYLGHEASLKILLELKIQNTDTAQNLRMRLINCPQVMIVPMCVLDLTLDRILPAYTNLKSAKEGSTTV